MNKYILKIARIVFIPNVVMFVGVQACFTPQESFQMAAKKI